MKLMPGAPPLLHFPDKTKRRSNAESQPKNTRRPGKIYGACNRCPVVRHVACLQLGATNPTNPKLCTLRRSKCSCVCVINETRHSNVCVRPIFLYKFAFLTKRRLCLSAESHMQITEAKLHETEFRKGNCLEDFRK